MYCQSRLCLEGKQLRGRQAQNCNVILAAIFMGGGGGTTRKHRGGLKRVGHREVNTVENNDSELRFSGTESGTSLIMRGQMSSLLAVSLVAGGGAFSPSVSFSLSLTLSLFLQVCACFMNLIKSH